MRTHSSVDADVYAKKFFILIHAWKIVINKDTEVSDNTDLVCSVWKGIHQDDHAYYVTTVLNIAAICNNKNLELNRKKS